jgi:hypothetical protein
MRGGIGSWRRRENSGRFASDLIAVAFTTHTTVRTGRRPLGSPCREQSYSLRSAVTGSTRDARRAGTKHARVATLSRMNDTTVAVEM